MKYVKLFENFIVESYSKPNQELIKSVDEFLKKWPPAFVLLSYKSHGEKGLQEYNKDERSLIGVDIECVDYNNYYQINFFDEELMKSVHPTKAVIKTFELTLDEANKQLKPFRLSIPKYTEY